MITYTPLRPGQTVAKSQRNTSQHCRPSIWKLRPNDRNISTQQIATLLGAICCTRLATLLRRIATCCKLKIELLRMPRRNIVAQTWICCVEMLRSLGRGLMLLVNARKLPTSFCFLIMVENSVYWILELIAHCKKERQRNKYLALNCYTFISEHSSKGSKNEKTLNRAKSTGRRDSCIELIVNSEFTNTLRVYAG